SSEDPSAFTQRMNHLLRPHVVAENRLTTTIVEVVVRAPQAARKFHPGEFYRLQNFETLADRVDGTTLAMEGLALTGAWTEPESGLVGTIVLEMGGSSDLCMLLNPGEPVILMGPTGTPTETPAGETVLLAGGGGGNAVRFFFRGGAGQCGAVFHRPGAACRGIAGALFRRLQAPAGSLQGGGNRGRRRRGRLGLRRGAGL